MGLKREYARRGARVYRDKRWPAVRLQAKRRDGWKCVKCGSRYRLEVDHIQPVRDYPEGAFLLANLQTLCGPCHGRKTQVETGNYRKINAKRKAWLDACDNLMS